MSKTRSRKVRPIHGPPAQPEAGGLEEIRVIRIEFTLPRPIRPRPEAVHAFMEALGLAANQLADVLLLESPTKGLDDAS